MPAKIVPGRNALRSISGRKAGQDHARTQCPLRERCQKQLFPSTVHRPPKWNVGEDCAVTQCRRLRREVMLAGARKNPLSSLVVKRCEKPPSRRAHTPPQAVPPRSSGDLEAGLEKNMPRCKAASGRKPLRSTVKGSPSSESDVMALRLCRDARLT